jgi:hypothetical protein
MYPEDRVLIAWMPEPADFELVRQKRWYRIPLEYAPKGMHAEYIAFYFGNEFGAEKWAIHYYCQRLGHELTTRAALFPDQTDHPRADHLYYKLQLGPLIKLERPIVSLRWRRMTFVHTTWDRFQEATEINDLLLDGEGFVDRLYATLKEQGLQPERGYEVKEGGLVYEVPLAVPCRDGTVQVPISGVPHDNAGINQLAKKIAAAVAAKGGEYFC